MIEFIAYISLFAELFGALFAWCEMQTLFLDMQKGKFVHDIASVSDPDRKAGHKKARTHTLEHILILMMTILVNFGFLTWLFVHDGFWHAWNVHILEEKLWIFIVLFGIFKIFVSNHLKTERLDSYKYYYDQNADRSAS